MNISYTLILSGIFCITISESRAEQEVGIHQYKEFAIYAFKSEMGRKSEIVRDVMTWDPYRCLHSNCECNTYSTFSYPTNDTINYFVLYEGNKLKDLW